ncbi:helicase HerA-like domain-containing protein [Neomicrococcus lactis]
MATTNASDHVEKIRSGYTFTEPSIVLGAAKVEDQVYPDALVRLPLGMMNRHGLVAGATGTGKTITLQVLTEQLSEAGVPVFVSDVKGDLTGLSTAGTSSEKLLQRTQSVGMQWEAKNYPVEYFALGGDGNGIPVRATITSFGPILLARILELNETQESSLQLIFHYADKKGLELIDLKDLRAVISHLTSDEGKDELKDLGGLSKATAGVILRELITLEAQGMEKFFGEPEFNTAELLRQAPDGRGVISSLELSTLLEKPLLFSTFLMWLLADLFSELPEVGDVEKPKLVFFLDEAHLLFRGASNAFLESIMTTVRLIRSKGVGIFFVTQTPKDVPGDVLGQLANRVQHALRAFTPDDAKALKQTISTFPTSDYDLEEALTQAGTGEAIVTVMNESGAPTPVAWTKMWTPRSQMGASDATIVTSTVQASPLLSQYGTAVDGVSAFEKLNGAAESVPATGESAQAPNAQGQPAGSVQDEARRIEEDILGRPASVPPAPQQAPQEAPAPQAEAPKSRPKKQDNVVMDVALDVANQLGREFLRGIFGTRRRRR